jgi:hypothetical protein
MQVVIEIRGGTLVGLYADDPEVNVTVVDWDDPPEDIAHDVRLKADRLEDMPSCTREVVTVCHTGR